MALPRTTIPPFRILGIPRPPGPFPTCPRRSPPASPNTPIIDGAFAQNVVSLGAYTFVNDALYVEASVYTTLNPNAQIALGPIHSPRPACSTRHPIGVWLMSRIGATLA